MREGAREVPVHFDAEVGQTLRGLERGRALSRDDAAWGLAGLARLPLTRHALEPLLEPAWQLRGRITFYDALYVALAQRLEVPLLTCDERLARTKPPVEVVVP